MGYWSSAIAGAGVEMPHAVGAKIHGNWDSCLKSKIGMEWVHFYKKCYDRLVKAECDNITLAQENLRLKHENEFMLRLINERENG